MALTIRSEGAPDRSSGSPPREVEQVFSAGARAERRPPAESSGPGGAGTPGLVIYPDLLKQRLPPPPLLHVSSTGEERKGFGCCVYSSMLRDWNSASHLEQCLAHLIHSIKMC